VYALGVMLREMLTGRAPGSQLVGRVKLPPRLVSALDRALAAEPAARFATMDDFRAALLASDDDERRGLPTQSPSGGAR
jgi:hypothetical protein